MGDRVAIVTGANRGIGLEVASQLAQRGYQVVLTGRRAAAVDEAVDALVARGLTAVPSVLDVSKPVSVAAFERWCEETYGRIDVLVNNAAILPEGHVAGSEAPNTLRVTAETVQRAFQTNVLGAYRMTQWVLPKMNGAGYGRVVNVSSAMGALSDMGEGYPAYRISKTAVHAVTKLFHHEAGSNVKVNAVCPGWVRTEMGGENATRSVGEGAAGILWGATLPDDGPSGGFFRDGEPLDW